MEKTIELRNNIKELEKQILKGEQLIADSKKKIEQTSFEIAEYYKKYFDNKRNTEFVLYNRFPSEEVLKLYLTKINEKFPLYEFGNIDGKELAELIKHCYQFQRGSEYDILTIGVNEIERISEYGWESWTVIPHLYFMIGNDKTLASYREYDGQYVNEDRLQSSIHLNDREKDFICIELDSDWNNPKIDIECLTGNNADRQGRINYFNLALRKYCNHDFGSLKNIYTDKLWHKVGSKGRFGYNGIKDVLDFNVHIFDTFLARILVSVSIYKRNNRIEKLTEEDYNHIFDVLYGEKVDIIKQAEIDVPKKLIYVPNKEYGR